MFIPFRLALDLMDIGRSFACVEAPEALAIHGFRMIAILVYAVDNPRLIVIVKLDFAPV